MWQSSAWQIISAVLYFMNMVLAVFISANLILRKQDPVKTLAWLTVLILLPYFGVICYLLFGQNYRKRKIFSRKGIADYKLRRAASISQLELLRKNDNLLGGELAPFKKLIYQNLKNSHTLIDDNESIDFFFTGKEALDAMFNGMESAKHHIHLQSYIFDDDQTGIRFKDLLVKKALQGVEVKVMVDGVGSFFLRKSIINEMRDAGIEVIVFSPLRLIMPFSKINYRNHRKVLIIDGRSAFMGGVNIADRYYYGALGGGWHDTHIRIKGESVFSLQACFLMDRNFALNRRKWRFRKKYYPPIEINNDRLMEGQHIYSQIISSGPDSDWSSIMQSYFSAITVAKRHIYIVTPYFTPCETILNALKIAALGDVDVRIMLPEKSDTKIAHWSTMSYIAELLEAGVKIYLFKKGFNHSKVISIDGMMSIVGSANMDVRSFEHNFEIMGVIYNGNCAGVIEKQFLHDLKSCKQISAGKWASRSRKDKVKESLARLWGPLL